MNTTRRQLLSSSFAILPLSSAPFATMAQSTATKLRVGFMLPYTGTFAQLGVAIENGFHLGLKELGGEIGGREVEVF